MKRMRRRIAWMSLLLVVGMLTGIFFLPAVSGAKDKDALDVSSDGIAIDGYYDEWKDFPDTDITYLSNNTKSVHKGNIYSDGDYLYVHVKMNDLYESQMQFHTFNLKINDKETAIPILGVKEDGSIDWSVPIYGDMPEGTHTNLAVFLGYYTPCDSSVAFTVYDKKHATDTEGDEIEFRIRMKDITKYFGIDADSIDTIAVSNPNIGKESLVYAGSSTAPFVGAAISFVLVLGGFGVYKYKRNKGMVR